MSGPSLEIDTQEAETFFPEVWLISNPSILLMVSTVKNLQDDQNNFEPKNNYYFLIMRLQPEMSKYQLNSYCVYRAYE